MKPLLIGQAPNSTDSGDPLSGRAGQFLATIAGLNWSDFLAMTERRNLLGRFPGKAGKGDRFPAREARDAASKIVLDARHVLAVGKAVAGSLGVKNPVFLSRVDLRGGVVGVIPHASGIVRWWNDPENRKAAVAFVRQFLLDALRSERDSLWSDFCRMPRRESFSGLHVAGELDRCQRCLDLLEGNERTRRHVAEISIEVPCGF